MCTGLAAANRPPGLCVPDWPGTMVPGLFVAIAAKRAPQRRPSQTLTGDGWLELGRHIVGHVEIVGDGLNVVVILQHFD